MTKEKHSSYLIAFQCITILKAFEHLQHKLQTLKSTLNANHALPGWFESPQSLNLLTIHPNTTVREKAFVFVQQLNYLNNKKPKTILLCPCVIVASNDTLNQVEQLNKTKTPFKTAIIALKQLNLSSSHPSLTKIWKKQRSSNTQQAIKQMDLARLHLKQCYRKLPIFQTYPKKTAWTWANIHSMKKFSIQDDLMHLDRLKHKHGILQQIQQLKTLPAHESLALIQELAPHFRVNIVFPEQITLKRLMLKGATPIFYPYDQKHSIIFQKLQHQKKKRLKLSIVSYSQIEKSHQLSYSLPSEHIVTKPDLI